MSVFECESNVTYLDQDLTNLLQHRGEVHRAFRLCLQKAKKCN